MMGKGNCLKCGKPTTRMFSIEMEPVPIIRELPSHGFRQKTYRVYMCSQKCENLRNKPYSSPPPKKIEIPCNSCDGTGKIKGYTCCTCNGTGKKWKMM